MSFLSARLQLDRRADLASTRRDQAAARRFFVRALTQGRRPVEVTTDKAPVYPRFLDEILPLVGWPGGIAPPGHPTKVEHLPAFNPGHRPTPSDDPHPEHGPASCRRRTSGSSSRHSVAPGCPGFPPWRRPVFFRDDFGGGCANPSELGGFPEFRDVFATWASSSAIRARACSNAARNCAIRPACSSTSAASPSYDGTGGAGGSGHTRTLRPDQPHHANTPDVDPSRNPSQPGTKTDDLHDLTGYSPPTSVSEKRAVPHVIWTDPRSDASRTSKVHPGLVDDAPSSSASLRGVHGDVGGVEQAVGVGELRAGDRHTGAR
ncbi:hypothetical protein FrEUN1fDRAFT_7411 [Parafrankia sp. EUN1f]|nr:hypothetical protein FrEUN1fDRAFT_7411 [Parafrankia sp. EUN1f]